MLSGAATWLDHAAAHRLEFLYRIAERGPRDRLPIARLLTLAEAVTLGEGVAAGASILLLLSLAEAVTLGEGVAAGASILLLLCVN
jgi:hypothetical protein